MFIGIKFPGLSEAHIDFSKGVNIQVQRHPPPTPNIHHHFENRNINELLTVQQDQIVDMKFPLYRIEHRAVINLNSRYHVTTIQDRTQGNDKPE